MTGITERFLPCNIILAWRHQALTNGVHRYMLPWCTQNNRFYKLLHMIIFEQLRSLTYFFSFLSPRNNCKSDSQNQCDSFHFMFCVFQHAVLNLNRVSKINLQWSCLAFFLSSLVNNSSWKDQQQSSYNLNTLMEYLKCFSSLKL